MLGFFLAITVFGVIDHNKPDVKATSALAIGFVVGLGHFALINMTGASMNPARSFGPALIAGNWKGHWVRAPSKIAKKTEENVQKFHINFIKVHYNRAKLNFTALI